MHFSLIPFSFRNEKIGQFYKQKERTLQGPLAAKRHMAQSSAPGPFPAFVAPAHCFFSAHANEVPGGDVGAAELCFGGGSGVGSVPLQRDEVFLNSSLSTAFLSPKNIISPIHYAEIVLYHTLFCGPRTFFQPQRSRHLVLGIISLHSVIPFCSHSCSPK